MQFPDQGISKLSEIHVRKFHGTQRPQSAPSPFKDGYQNPTQCVTTRLFSISVRCSLTISTITTPPQLLDTLQFGEATGGIDVSCIFDCLLSTLTAQKENLEQLVQPFSGSTISISEACFMRRPSSGPIFPERQAF